MTQRAESRFSWTGFVLVFVLLSFVGGATLLAVLPKTPEAVAPVPAKSVPVAVQPVVVQDVPETVVYPGRIEAVETVRLAVERPGVVVALGAGKGDRVVQGQLLLALDSRAQSNLLARAQVELQQAENDLRRMEELRKTGSVPVRDVETAEARRDMARIAASEAALEREKCELRSPLRGVVEERRVETGEYVAPGQPVFEIVDASRVFLVVHVPERDVYAVRTGQPIAFQVDALPDRSFTGQVTRVASVADPQSNTFRVEIAADNSGGTLKPGALARAALNRRVLAQAVCVPLRALVPVKGQHIAFLVEQGHAVRRVVRIAAVMGTVAIVQEGLQPGDRVITEGHRTVADGSAVREVGETESRSAP